MKTSLFKTLTLGALCASMIGMAAFASAYGPGDRIRAQIASLKVAKDSALAHHHYRSARNIQGQINALKARLHHHHW